MPDRHVGVQIRCFLCDHDFHRVSQHGIRQQLNLIALFAVDGSARVVSDQSSRINDFIEDKSFRVRFRARGAWHEWRRYHPGMTGIYSPTHWADSDFEEDTKYCGQCRPGGPLFFSHADCWKVAQRHDIDVNQLYTFAMQTQPLLPWKGDGPHTRLWGFFNCVGTLNTETELGEFLVEISRRLPPELHEDILADLQRSAGYKVRNICMDAAEFETMLKAGEVLFTRLAAVESQVVPTLKSISSRTTLVNLLPLKAPASLPDQFMSNVRDTFLWIRPTNIFGRAYISEVGVGQRRSGVLSIPLSQNQITGLRFALGKFGVRAIRILYDGGSKSAWLGDPSGCWFGNVPGTNIRDLATTADGLRVVRLDLDRGSILNGKRNMFLDTEIDTLPGELVPFSANDQALRPPLMTNPYYRRWDLLTCLPLMFGLCYTSGLTVYWDDYTVIGMVSYGPENQSAFVGRRSKNAMHVSLATKEFFTTFWVGSSNFTHVLRGRPFVLSLTTNLGRSCHFGPHHMLRHQRDTSSVGARWETIGAWNLGVKITGILVDPYGHLNMHGYHNFGIVDEPVHHLLRTAEERVPTRAPTEKLPKDENRHFPLYRLTTGSLHDVTGMEVRRHGNRCLGLRILHPNGQDDCLGSWDPLDTSSITTIYESHQGPLTALRFHMAEGECHFVSGITPCVKIADRGQRIPASSLEEEDPHESLTPPAEPSDFKQYKCGQPGKMLGWWCDEKRDEIRSFEPVAPERVPNTDVRMQMSMRWQPPPAGSNYRQWGDE